MGKKVGSWEGERVRLSQGRGQRTEDRGRMFEVGSWNAEGGNIRFGIPDCGFQIEKETARLTNSII